MSGGIAHVVQRMSPGGIETLVLELVRAGGTRDIIISLDAERSALVRDWPALAPVSDQIFACAKPPGLRPSAFATLYRLFREHRPAAVFVHHIGPLVYAGTAARFASVARLVHVEHDGWHYRSAKHRAIARAAALALAPARVAVSDEIAAIVRGVVPGAKVSTIANGVDLERYRPGDKQAARARLGLPVDARIIGTAGRLVEVKAQDQLIDALALMPHDTHAVIVGGGPLSGALASRAQLAGVAGRVHLLGHRDDLQDILPAFDIFCLPSLAEGLPRSVVEAQACGLPVVASDVGAVRQAVCEQTGILVEPGQPGRLAEALSTTLLKPLTVSPRAFVAQRFSFAETVAAYRLIAGV